MNIEYYFKYTDDDAVQQEETELGFVTRTKFGNVITWNKDRNIIFMKWVTPKGEILDIDNPEFSNYYLQSYSENMLRIQGE